MKRSKRLFILLGILAVFGAATFGVMQYEEKKEEIKNSDEIILEIDPDSVESLSWEYEDTSLSFHKDETWLYDNDENFPVDQDKITELLSLFEEFGVSFIIENVEDYGQYGLDTPLCTIAFSTADTSYELLLGDYSKMDSERYVSLGDGNVYLVSTDPLDYYDAVLSDMLADDEIPFFDLAEQLTFEGSENYSLFYEEDSDATYCAEDVYFTTQDGNTLPLDTENVNAYLDTISNLGLSEYVTYNATEEELAACGLDEPELTVSVDYSYEDEDGEEISDTFVLHISRDPDEAAEETSEEAASETTENSDAETADTDAAGSSASDTEESGETEEEITAYARIGDSQILYRLSSADYKALMEASYDDLRHKEVLTADFHTIYQIDVSLEGTDYTITSEEEDEEKVYFYEGEELDITNLRSAAKALTAYRFTDEEPSEKEEISLTFYLENETYPQVQVQLYRYDGSYCLAAVDGEPVSLVERSYVVDLIEAVNSIVLN